MIDFSVVGDPFDLKFNYSNKKFIKIVKIVTSIYAIEKSNVDAQN